MDSLTGSSGWSDVMPTAGQIGKALAVDVTLHAGDAAVVDIDVTDDMRGRRATRIETALFGPETDAGNAERQDLALLFRGQLAAQPLETRIRGQLRIGAFDVEVVQNRRQLLDHFVGVDDLVGLGKQRNRADVGRQNRAVAVDEVGA